MKIKLLFAFVVLSLVSCNDSDDTNPVVPVVEKKLDKITYNRFSTNGSVTSTGTIEFDDNNKITLDSGFSTAGIPVSLKTYIYNETGLLAELDEHESGTSNNTKYKYDTSGRVIESDNNFAVVEGVRTLKTFSYNNDNTIAVHENITSYGPGGDENITRNYTYHVNTAGYIYKTISSDGTIMSEAVYQGDNVVSYTTSNTTVSYGFDNLNMPIGQYHNITKNTYGGNDQNAVLLSGFLAVANNYIVSQNSGNSTQTYEYEFDSDGYPFKVKFFRNGNVQPYLIREIFYQ